MKLFRLIAAAGLAATLGGTAMAQQLGIGTMSQGTLGYSMGSTISKVLSDNGIVALVQPSAGTSAYLPLIDSGELDLGIANVIEAKEAAEGAGGFEGRPLENLRAVSVLFPFRVGIFVRADSDIETIADLRGKNLAYGFTSQVTLKDIMDAILATADIGEGDFNPVLVPNVGRGADDLASGKADAFFFALGAGKVSETDATVGGLRLLPLPEGAEAAIQEQVPEAYVTTVEPAPNLAGVTGATPTMAYDYLLLGGAHVPDETMAAVVKTLHANKQALADGFAPFRAFDPAQMKKELPLPYHDGAEAALQELGS